MPEQEHATSREPQRGTHRRIGRLLRGNARHRSSDAASVPSVDWDHDRSWRSPGANLAVTLPAQGGGGEVQELAPPSGAMRLLDKHAKLIAMSFTSGSGTAAVAVASQEPLYACLVGPGLYLTMSVAISVSYPILALGERTAKRIAEKDSRAEESGN